MAGQFVTMMTPRSPDERPLEVTILQMSERSGANGLDPDISQMLWAADLVSCTLHTSEDWQLYSSNLSVIGKVGGPDMQM